jgi:hypothetical protein
VFQRYGLWVQPCLDKQRACYGGVKAAVKGSNEVRASSWAAAVEVPVVAVVVACI